MSKVSIAFKLLNILIDGRRYSAKELEEKLEIKNSTLRWHINELITSGFTIYSVPGVGGGYRLDKKMCINNIWKLIEKQ